MKKIIVLPPEISEKIAAGEVIERPFSVVKELIENSLDAGASEVKVELLAGGKKLIRVQDNGCGMSREDALLSFERHSTSKICREDDLARIKTLGFRGEALASISAVSRLILKTFDGEGGQGIQVEREAGNLPRVSDIAFPRGTSVEVMDLFFNLPARRKFLRSDQSELQLIVKYLTSVALAYPEVKFSLMQGKREILSCPQVSTLKERIYQLYGRSLLESLMEISYQDAGSRLSGYSSCPPSGKSDKTHQLFFVNKRPVRDRILQASLNQAYRGFLEKDFFPEAFLFVSLPWEEVDVNVHPSKAEVRFKDSPQIYRLILNGIERAMGREKGIKEIYPLPHKRPPDFRVEEKAIPLPFDSRQEKRFAAQDFRPILTEQQGEITYPRVLGQYLDTYIVAAKEDGILIIDQHNAHERVLFEKYREIDKKKEWPQKMPLLPLLFELSPSQVLSFESNKAHLEEAGFIVDSMGGRSYVLKEFPDIFEDEEAKETFLVLLEEMRQEPSRDPREKILATMACKTAIKARQPLLRERMEYLLEELFKTSNPSLCPHGRPVIVKLERAQIEKGLKRNPN